MNRDYLFMSGEYEVSMPAVFSMSSWMHTMIAKKLEISSGSLRRKGIDESLKGVVFFHDSENISIGTDNLNLLADNEIPCWPNPRTLLAMEDRHRVMNECVDRGFVTHDVEFVENSYDISLNYPYVVKVGQEHRGQGKYLVKNSYDEAALEKWNGVATVEPFFEGCSFRVLIVGSRSWGVWYDNPDSWIKNSCGASIVNTHEFTEEERSSVERHARSVASSFGLDVAGVDYIVNKDSFNFLEINQFPGLNVCDDAVKHAKLYLIERMKEVEDSYRHASNTFINRRQSQ